MTNDRRGDAAQVWQAAARAVGLAAVSIAWGTYNGRLLLRALHMLQLEGYQTARFLRWSAAKPERWARTDRVVLALVAAG
jgi:hypothetical protein